MSKYYGEVSGIGHKTSKTAGSDTGIIAHIRGWNFGIEVRITSDDEITAWLTGGSNAPSKRSIIGTFYPNDMDKKLSLISIPIKQKGE